MTAQPEPQDPASSCGDDQDLDDIDGVTFGSELWDGDEGTLNERQRNALVVLLKNEFISSTTHLREFTTLAENPNAIRSMLHNLFLDLRLDPDREVAYKRPIRVEGRTFRTLLYDTAYNREETILLVFLREQLRAQGAAGTAHVHVDASDMHDYVARLRPSHDTDEAGGKRRVDNAIAYLLRSKLITAGNPADNRFRISPAVETLLPMNRLTALLRALHEQNHAPSDPEQSISPELLAPVGDER